jgi:hypothetical protein
MQFFEVSCLIGKGLSIQLVVIFRRGNILRENSLVLQSFINIVRIEPIVAAFVLHNFDDSASVDLLYVFVVQVLVENGIVVFIFLLPSELILVQSESVSKDLLPKVALILEMFILHFLVMLVQVCVLDLVEILNSFFMDSLPSLLQSSLVCVIGDVGLRLNSGLAKVIAEDVSEEHHCDN